ncbi:MAG: lamin tail domain-containing protein, partial [Patescibacteria group bacterium]
QEWVELYNGTSSDVLLENWTIEDNYSSDTLPAITLPAGKFGVIVTESAATPLKTQIISNGAVVIELGSNGIGNGLSKDGDRLILKNDKGVVVDQVSWGEDTSIFTLENILSGQSIIRNPLGKDTDTAADWQTNTSPNPGTNPHSHIQVSLKQSNNDLLIGFTNAFGFDLVKYNITYSHEVEGQRITERVEGEESKVFENTALDLKPIYFGTCSSLGKVCVPHKQVDDVVVSLLYKNGQEILGTSTIPFTWNNTK